jgi:hypothetical protein
MGQKASIYDSFIVYKRRTDIRFSYLNSDPKTVQNGKRITFEENVQM